jgi:hypothetical protein
MTTIHNRLALVLALSLGFTGLAQAVTVAGSSTITDPRAKQAETVSTGTVSSIDTKRGVLAVSGRTYRFTPATVSFSDDRKKPTPEGLAGLKPGNKVTVRSVTRDGGNQAVQIVVKD